MDCWRILSTNEIQAQRTPAVAQRSDALLKSVRFSVMGLSFSAVSPD